MGDSDLKAILERMQQRKEQTGKGYAFGDIDYNGRRIRAVGESLVLSGNCLMIDGIKINLDSVIACHPGNEGIFIDSNGEIIHSSCGVIQNVLMWHRFSTDTKRSKQSWARVGKVAGGSAILLGAVFAACYFLRKSK